MQVAPLRRIISLVITNTAAAERPTVLCSFVTEVTGMSIAGPPPDVTGVLASCSMGRLRRFSSSLVWLDGAAPFSDGLSPSWLRATFSVMQSTSIAERNMPILPLCGTPR